MNVTAICSIFVGILSFYYRNNTHIFLLCMGREEWFAYDLNNMSHKLVGATGLNLEHTHPWRILMCVALLGFNILVPMLYYKIFKFRKEQNISITGNQFNFLFFGCWAIITGISAEVRKKRKWRNLASTKINLLAWILQERY